MSKNVCVLLAEGFEEVEAVTLIDVLRRGGISVTTAALGPRRVKGAHDIVIEADVDIDQARDRPWDMVLLPGGLPGSTNLRDDERVGALLRETAAGGRYVGAICAAPIALAAHGVLDGKQATSYPGFGEQMPGCRYSEERVVRDGRVMTSRGPGTAMAFALAIVAELASADRAATLRAQMLVEG